MRNLYSYIVEREMKKKKDKDDDKKSKVRSDIKFTIWKSPRKQASWLKDDEEYQKIEYKYIDDENNINIDFLLGKKNDIWNLWTGKIGVCDYMDDPYCSLDTKSFKKAVVKSLDEIEDFIDDVKENPEKYTQYITGV